MATKVGGVEIEIRGNNSDFNRTMREVERQAGRSGQTVTREFKQADRAVQSVTTSMGALRGAIGGVVSVLASGVMAKAAIDAADAFAGMRSKIALSITAADDLLTVEEQLYRQAVANRAALEPTVALYQRLRGARADLTNEQTLNITDRWSKTLIVSGASAQGAAAATLQFSQAIAGGVLRAEEFNSIIENNIRFVKLLADSLGVSVGQVRNLVNEGAITSDIIFKALTENAQSLDAEFAKIPVTVSSAMTNVQNAFVRYIGLQDQAAGTSAKLAGAINAMAQDFDRFADMVIVAAATAGGALAGLAAARIVSGILAIASAAGTATGALGAMRGALAFFGGPVGLAITAVAGTFAYLAITSEDALEQIAAASAEYDRAVGKIVQTQEEMKGQYAELERLNRDMAKAIEDGATAAELAASREIDALQLRIDKNRELMGLYEEQIAAALDDARAGRDRARNDFSSAIGLGRRFDYNTNPEARAELDAATRAFQQQLAAQRATGRALDDNQRKARDYFLAWQEAEQQVAALSRRQGERIVAAGVNAMLGPAGSAGASGGGTGTVTEPDADAAKFAEALALKEAIYAIDLARAEGNETLARHLEEELAIMVTALDYQSLGLDAVEAMDRAIRDVITLRRAETAELERQADIDRQRAEDAADLVKGDADASRALILARARGNSDEIRALEQILDFRRRVADYERQGLSAADAVDQAEKDIAAIKALERAEMREAIANQIAAGLEEGIRTGNWGEAFRNILASSTSEALSNAIDNLADELLTLLESVFSGSGSSNFGGVGSIFGNVGTSIATFLGGRAGGGPVRAGMRYMVGEQGPEMFIPSVPGTIVPKFEGPASVAQGGLTGGHVVNVSPQFHVHGSITEEVLPRVQRMFAEYSRQIPRVVDARVSDSLRRGRY